MKRNWTALALALSLTLTLTVCDGNPDAAETSGNAAPTSSQTPVAESDLNYVKDNGVLKIGYTPFEPMDYLGEDGELTGFETEFATAVCAKLGVEPKFVETNWNAELLELENKNVDCIWSDMAITPKPQKAVSISDPYIKDYQVVVIRATDTDKYTSTESPTGANLDAEAGSAGETAVAVDEFLSQASYTSVVKQTGALLEVRSGAADAAAMDFVLANTLVGAGDYSGLMVIPDLELSVEKYGVGFRQGSDLTAAINQAIRELIGDGTLNELAVRYELADLLPTNQ